MVRSLETSYAGLLFRSRLEAKWAIFFDHLRMRWVYEPQGVTLNDGTLYLPDFLLPGPGVYVEVKGTDEALERDFGTLAQFANELAFESTRGDPTGLLLLGDVPDIREDAPIPCHSYLPGMGGAATFAAMFLATRPASVAALFAQHEATTRAFSLDAGLVHPQIRRAYNAARKARFEHGETPMQPEASTR